MGSMQFRSCSASRFINLYMAKFARALDSLRSFYGTYVRFRTSALRLRFALAQKQCCLQ